MEQTSVVVALVQNPAVADVMGRWALRLRPVAQPVVLVKAVAVAVLGLAESSYRLM